MDLYLGKFAAEELPASSFPDTVMSGLSGGPCRPEAVAVSLPCPLLSLELPFAVAGLIILCKFSSLNLN